MLLWSYTLKKNIRKEEVGLLYSDNEMGIKDNVNMAQELNKYFASNFRNVDNVFEDSGWVPHGSCS